MRTDASSTAAQAPRRPPADRGDGGAGLARARRRLRRRRAAPAACTDRKAVDGRGIEISREKVNACVARGLSVIQGDADRDLADYPDQAFDYAILSLTIQATRHPKTVLENLLRIGRHAIVSFPNFGHWQIRWQAAVRRPHAGDAEPARAVVCDRRRAPVHDPRLRRPRPRGRRRGRAGRRLQHSPASACRSRTPSSSRTCSARRRCSC